MQRDVANLVKYIHGNLFEGVNDADQVKLLRASAIRGVTEIELFEISKVDLYQARRKIEVSSQLIIKDITQLKAYFGDLKIAGTALGIMVASIRVKLKSESRDVKENKFVDKLSPAKPSAPLSRSSSAHFSKSVHENSDASVDRFVGYQNRYGG